MLQEHFAIVRGADHFWDCEMLKDIMKACNIIHNVIVEDERDVYILNLNYNAIDEYIAISHEHMVELVQFIQNHHRIRNKEIHSQITFQKKIIEIIMQFINTRD